MARLCCSAQEIREIFVALRHDRPAPRPYSRTMKQPDLAEVARRYLDLWEQQVSTYATTTPSVAAADAARIMAEALTALEQSGKGVRIGGPATTPAAPAAPGIASIDGDDLHDQFARRLAQCAERFAALAARTPSGGAGANGGPDGE